MKIIIITPIRNEEKHIETTIDCMLAQTVLPLKWIIVNDGSTDNTEKIIKGKIKDSSFIEHIALPDRGFRKPGQGVVETFNKGLKRIGNIDYDIVSKFDGDLEFPHDTLEKICLAFENNPRLGITGGGRYEQHNNVGPFKRVIVPEAFVGGPNKFYRKKCFEDIGGLIPRAGWDGVDTIKANMENWETGEMDSIKILHLKPTGMAKGEGLKKACEKYGDVSFYMGGYLWYFILRVVGRSLESRNLLVGYFMIKGYIKSMMSPEPRESKQFRDFLKKTQVSNVSYLIKAFLGMK